MTCDLKLFAVAGAPGFQSYSPEMFLAAFRTRSINALYLRFALSKAEEIGQTARRMNIRGFNLKSPWKEEILPFLDDIDETAQKIDAVNTILLDKDKLKGYNTDIEGFRKAFLTHGIMLNEKKALVLGAGGTAKAAAYALITEGAEVTIINHIFEKGQKVARDLKCRVAHMEDLRKEIEHTGIIVSCLDTNRQIVPSSRLTKDHVVLDTHYGEKTPLVRDAKTKGCKIVDGREWLLFQSAEAFNRFTEQEAPVESMRWALYAHGVLKKKNIALVGFMGAGKSTVGRHLAERLKMPLIDIDNVIEREFGSSIREIFEEHGEHKFRSMEANAINGVANMSGRIVSCGGGAVLNRDSVDHLKTHAMIVWLSAETDTIIRRLANDTTRPLLKVDDKETEVSRILHSRMPHYAYASDLFINTDEKKPEEIAERIHYESAPFLKN
jgi:shikimate dehydrogenase